MKTKLVCPWNLKVGQKLVHFDLYSGGKFTSEILEIKKETGRFTGRPIWRVKTDNLANVAFNFHAKSSLLPVQKAEILVEIV